MVRRAVPDSIGNAVDALGSKLADLGLPVARSSGVQGRRYCQSSADDSINEAAKGAGLDLSQIPKLMLDQVRQQTAKALASGKKFDTAAALRQTEGNMVLPKSPLTLGQVTRGPQQFADEVNLPWREWGWCLWRNGSPDRIQA